jgi:uncharacterized membrane protein YedE/YeeE
LRHDRDTDRFAWENGVGSFAARRRHFVRRWPGARRVLGFLDPFGSWDPTLAFVMAGATAVMALAWLIKARIRRPLLGERFFVPGRRDVDAGLIAGSALFGIGWGLAGICPGPAVALVALDPAIVVFIVAMLAGMMVHRLVEAPLRSSR